MFIESAIVNGVITMVLNPALVSIIVTAINTTSRLETLKFFAIVAICRNTLKQERPAGKFITENAAFNQRSG